MKTGFTKSDKILWLSCTPSLVAFAAVILLYQDGALTKDASIFYGALSMIPLFASLFIYSLVTGNAPVKGLKVSKIDNPGLYFAATSFWGILTLMTLLYILSKI